MALLDLPTGYSVLPTSTGYAAHSPYGLIADDFDCWAAACFAAQDHADSLALDDADEVAAIADYEAEQLLEAA